jgi:anti-anti-sigma regulatory factor
LAIDPSLSPSSSFYRIQPVATNDERPGLLSKVAMFVRNPTKDWSELDQPEQTPEAGYDKQALKAMIERKRQNDFVRRREFDQLRKLRNRDPGAIANIARASYFQTSLSTDPDGRAMTLKKIDEIEAQMSRQWWKGKQEGGVAGERTRPVGVAPDSISSQLPTQSPSIPEEAFEPTQSITIRSSNVPPGPEDYAETQMAGGNVDGADGIRRETNAGAAGFANSEIGFSASKLFAMSADEMATDPELEEAAIRFANGDDAGAEKGLLAALRGNDLQPESAQSWAAALLDLYRATGARAEFDRAALEFSLHLNGLQPQWAGLALGDQVAASQSLAVGSAHPKHGGAIWNSPAVLDAAGMEQLRDAMGSQGMPWHLGWVALTEIRDSALPLLDGLFVSLCDEPVEIVFSGSAALVAALRAKTLPGDRTVDRLWWQIRLNALRVMRLQDDFELAALDYCITHEVAPPPWISAQCRFEERLAEGTPSGDRPSARFSNAGPSTLPFDDVVADNQGSGGMALRGELLGDASQVLATLEKLDSSGTRLVIQCGGLIRVDFAAAGSILNWVAMRQAEGKQVQFRDVQRVVAAFFNVIGINEHAKVIPRPI